MKKSQNLSEYKAEYNRNAYDRLSLYIPKGERDLIKSAADRQGESVNAFIYRAIVERMEKLSPKDSAPLTEKTETDFLSE